MKIIAYENCETCGNLTLDISKSTLGEYTLANLVKGHSKDCFWRKEMESIIEERKNPSPPLCLGNPLFQVADK